MNKVILMGRLTRDPEVRETQGANPTSVARFSLAVDRRFKRSGEDAADFFNCTSFGKQAEFVGKYLTKGTKILVTGRLQTDNYTNKDGAKVYSVQIVCEEIEFAESKNASGGASADQAPTSEPTATAGDGFMNIPDGVEEELPFN